MPAPLVEAIGSLAAALTTLSFLPQVIKTWQHALGRGFLVDMAAAFTAGLFFWLLYGLAIGSWPVIGANVLTLALVLTIAFVKWREDA